MHVVHDVYIVYINTNTRIYIQYICIHTVCLPRAV